MRRAYALSRITYQVIGWTEVHPYMIDRAYGSPKTELTNENSSGVATAIYYNNGRALRPLNIPL